MVFCACFVVFTCLCFLTLSGGFKFCCLLGIKFYECRRFAGGVALMVIA